MLLSRVALLALLAAWLRGPEGTWEKRCVFFRSSREICWLRWVGQMCPLGLEPNATFSVLVFTHQ